MNGPLFGGHQAPTIVTLEGTLERIVYQNEENQWTVGRLRVAHASSSGSRVGEQVTVVGPLLGIKEGTEVRLHGAWIVDKKWGEQFKAETYQLVAPQTLSGIEKFLGSGMVPGIGPELAKRVVARFGLATLDIISASPDRLREVEGIGDKRAARIAAEWQDQRGMQDIMVFLQGHGVSTAFAVRIWKKYGAAALGIVRANPYRLALDIWGIGFRTADNVARNLGITKDSPERAEAGVLHVLGELTEDGHCHAPEHALLAEAEKLLEVGEDIIAPAIQRLVSSSYLVREELGDRGDCLSLHKLWEQEVGAAKDVGRLLHAPLVPVSLDLDKALAWFEKERGIQLAHQQREAVGAAIRDKLVVITGGPGTGKTTIVNAIIRILEKKNRRILLAAPTGRAAKRLAETTERPARTLHRLLEYNPQENGFARDAQTPLEADVVIVDETSMVDVPLFASLCAAIPGPAQLVLVGDVDQLPSVGPGRVLEDVIASKKARVVRLSEIFRQAAESAIITTAHRVNRGEPPDLNQPENSDFFFVERDDPQHALATILDLVAERIPRRFGFDAVDDVQVLAPMHRGDVGAQNLNTALQARLNPAGNQPELVRGQKTFRVGDKVIQLKNDYDKEVYNGDVGRVRAVQGSGLIVEIDARPVEYEPAELDQLAHAYALTVHKSQGSEYPAIVLPMVTQHFMMLQRNLLYTAITRGKRLVVLVGSKKALGLAVRNDETKLRWSWLAKRIETATSV